MAASNRCAGGGEHGAHGVVRGRQLFRRAGYPLRRQLLHERLERRGYAASGFTNTDATPPLSQEGTDAIFYHAWHALVVCATATACTAVSSAFAGSDPNSTTMTGLLGDPSAAQFQGPATVCSAGFPCRQVTLVNYPYESQMAKFNLAVFQSCNSAQDGALGYTSLATVAYNTGLVGTSSR
ncbi:hypothetical protein [Amycolatopsis sp.]|uniref:hypothetical protein n=1 Tax=Amycolatopsis sp. TaxID=37632 RepID=UPI002BD12B14|nr:hypothetical protein [Amycolatopsis sp.]HVV12018.1 hypothetical protein [Amycolatopsis sp.]